MTALTDECDILDAARAVGVTVLDDAADAEPTPEAERYRTAPLNRRGPVPLAVRDGRLQALWAPTPTAAQVGAYADEVGVPVEVVLARSELVAELADRHEPGRQPQADGAATHAIEAILGAAVELGASDVHLSAGPPPIVRIAGAVSPLPEFDRLTAADTLDMARWFGSDGEQDHDLAITFGDCRFRVNIYRQAGAVALACRALPRRVPALDSLGLPGSLPDLASLRHGLVLLCGPTGSGKSTTLAAIVDLINRTRAVHITTLEDPVEYVHTDAMAVVHHRQIGRDAPTFAAALRSALRQDPDVILVGEMRDTETIDAALTAAETGHLVLSTLHTGDAESSVSRIVNAFPEGRQSEARLRLATVLRAIVCQKLLPRTDDLSRCGVVSEILVNTRATSSLIRNGDTHQLRSVLETGAADGMRTFDQALADAVTAGWLDPLVARASTHDGRSYAAYLPA